MDSWQLLASNVFWSSLAGILSSGFISVVAQAKLSSRYAEKLETVKKDLSVELFERQTKFANRLRCGPTGSWWSWIKYTRRIIGFGVHAGTIDGVALCRMFNRAIRGQHWMPRYLSSDNDPLYRFHQWQANLGILEVTEIKSVPYVPLSHPFVERLIGTVRREYLDHILFWTTADLENKLLDFRTYFNNHRTHDSLEGRTPDTSVSRPIANLHSIRWQPHCRALYQTPVAA